MQTTKLRAIDGTQTTVAPPPSRGLAKLVYETVKELGGASEAQIKKYLPAMTENTTLYLDKKKFEGVLYSCVYSGYLITDGRLYRIAPKSYYSARQKIVQDSKARYLSGASKRDGKRKKGSVAPDAVVYERPMWHWLVLVSVGVITMCVGWLAGLVTGLLLTGGI